VKEKDFRRRLNELMDGASLTDSEMAFQMIGDEYCGRCCHVACMIHLYVCLCRSCTPRKPLNGVRCHSFGRNTRVILSNIVSKTGPGPPQEGEIWRSEPPVRRDATCCLTLVCNLLKVVHMLDCVELSNCSVSGKIVAAIDHVLLLSECFSSCSLAVCQHGLDRKISVTTSLILLTFCFHESLFIGAKYPHVIIIIVNIIHYY